MEKKILKYINEINQYNISEIYDFLDFIYDLSSEGYSKNELIETMTNLSTIFEDESLEHIILTDTLDFITGFYSTKDKKINDFIIYFRDKKYN